MPDHDDLAGKRIGNYRILQRIGSGGFAEVYLAEQIYLRSFAAIKLLHAALDPRSAENFRREARILKKLRHSNIIGLLDFGVGEESGQPYLIMDYAPGGSLEARYPRGTRVPLAKIVQYVDQAASALQYAHDTGFMHRDVKPANMLIGERGEVLLSDFGIAGLAPGGPARISNDSIWRKTFPAGVGTPLYVAPEQIEGKGGEASDQYSLAIVVYQWLCGRPPFDGENWAEVMFKRVKQDPPPLRDIIPAIPPDLEDVIMTGLAREPEHRYASVRAFADALIEAALPLDARETIPGAYTIPTVIPNPRRGEAPPPGATHRGRDAARARPPQPTSPPTLLLGRRTILTGMGAVIAAAGLGFALTRAPSVLNQSHARAQNAHRPAASLTRNTPAAQKTQGTTNAAIDVGTTLYEFRGHAGSVLALAWAPKGILIASGSLDHTVKIWHALAGSIVTNYTGHSAAVNTVAWSPDGSLIASGSDDKQVQIWNAATGSEIRFYANHQDVVNAVAWSPDGTLIASGSNDKTVQVWNVSTGALIRSYTGHQDVVGSVAWSSDGRYIASGSSDKTVQVWEAVTGQLFYTYTKHSAPVASVLWSHDGKRIASAADDKTVQVWDAFDGANGYVYQGHQGAVFAIALSPDGSEIASGSSDRTVQLWNFANGDPIYTYSQHTEAVNALTWSTDGREIASGGNDKLVLVWQSM